MGYVVYLHGFRSLAGSSSKTESLKDMLPDESVIGLEYAPHKPHEASAAIASAVADLGRANITGVVGTSLGGFWARWTATQYNLRAIAINPSLEPWKTLSAGTFQVYDSELTIDVSKEDVSDFAQFSITRSDENVLHIVAMDDEVLNAERMLELIGSSSGAKVRTFESGGHRFEKFSQLGGPIKDHLGVK